MSAFKIQHSIFCLLFLGVALFLQHFVQDFLIDRHRSRIAAFLKFEDEDATRYLREYAHQCENTYRETYYYATVVARLSIEGEREVASLLKRCESQLGTVEVHRIEFAIADVLYRSESDPLRRDSAGVWLGLAISDCYFPAIQYAATLPREEQVMLSKKIKQRICPVT